MYSIKMVCQSGEAGYWRGAVLSLPPSSQNFPKRSVGKYLRSQRLELQIVIWI